ncbi:alpha/beta fold hydrolase [Microlunatus parietis]|uniref:Pimeloyl-ACP methyl ester carboxylesterase n=1 Tax=Microlunatus parietis TaxID=682979 RepID=A0A7Y9IEC6_9ACTN|nr:alpha/beta fold hydrolase [Microlunatus parietis]NYE75187.1 pimeloyl-ACP methyl ester carboxylesterase [Microlunatus parietis]
MPFLELPSGAVRYDIYGPEVSAAPPVVLVHGLLNDAVIWTEVAERLAGQGIRSYAPDWPLGSHTVPRDRDADQSPRGIARLIVEFLAGLELSNVTLVGNDTGGALCQFVIDEDPSRVARLVLGNCDAFDVFPPEAFARLFAAMRSERQVALLAKLMRLRPLRQSGLGFGPLAHNLPADLTARWIRPLNENPGSVADLARFARAVDPAELLELSTRLHRFTGPVTLAWGTDDQAFTEELGRRLQQAFSDATFVPIPGARTLTPLDAPEALAEQIAAIAARPASTDQK